MIFKAGSNIEEKKNQEELNKLKANEIYYKQIIENLKNQIL